MGLGTIVNVAAIVAGTTVGLLLARGMPQRVNQRVVQAIGLFTIFLGVSSALALGGAELTQGLGSYAGVVILVGLLIGGAAGAAWRIDERLEAVADRVAGPHDAGERSPAAGLLTASVLFCAGPMTVLGSMQDGLGQGIELLSIKSVLDGVSSIAFAASFGPIIYVTAGVVALLQGVLTAVGFAVGSVLPAVSVAALEATGGLMLIGLGLSLVGAVRIAVADLLPALFVSPLLVWICVSLAT